MSWWWSLDTLGVLSWERGGFAGHTQEQQDFVSRQQRGATTMYIPSLRNPTHIRRELMLPQLNQGLLLVMSLSDRSVVDCFCSMYCEWNVDASMTASRC